MHCRCSYGTCNKCLVSRSLQSGLIFFAVSSPPVRQMTGDNIFYSTALFMLLAFLLMKLKSKSSGYRFASSTDMTKSPGFSKGAMINSADQSIHELAPFQ